MLDATWLATGTTLNMHPEPALGSLRSMRAVTIRDSELHVEEHPDPEPGAGEVLVRVRAAGLNGADMHQRLGRYPAPPGSPPDIPGLELAGEVAALGPGAQRFAEGDRVMGIVGGGGQAELAVVHERQLMPVPGRARLAGRRAGCPRCSPPPTTPSSPRPACGPASICSSTAAPAASAPRRSSSRTPAGARVTATVRNPELRERVAELGADGHRPRGLRRARPVRRHPRARRRAEPRPTNVNALHTLGRIVVIGIGAGRQGRAPPRRADGQARPDHGLDAPPPAARGEGGDRPGDGALGAAADRRRPGPRARRRDVSRSTRSRRPTSASPRAASSARSC